MLNGLRQSATTYARDCPCHSMAGNVGQDCPVDTRGHGQLFRGSEQTAVLEGTGTLTPGYNVTSINVYLTTPASLSRLQN
jgi:hypothetical protein